MTSLEPNMNRLQNFKNKGKDQEVSAHENHYLISILLQLYINIKLNSLITIILLRSLK